MIIKNYDDLICLVHNQPVRRAAIASAADSHTIESALKAAQENIAVPIFIGDESEIRRILELNHANACDFTIIHEADRLKTPYIASHLVNEGLADFVMKGFIDTSDFFRGILDKTDGLRTGNPMSHIAFLQIPEYGKLLAVTDGGMVTAPDYTQKKQILINAVQMLKKMGINEPTAAILTAVEKVNKSMPETLEAAQLAEECKQGLLGRCHVEGPVSYDIAISRESAQKKGFTGQFSGNYDLWLVPNIAAGNLMTKALIYNGHAKMAGLVAGAKCPLVLNSRSSSAEEKFYAIALAAAAAGFPAKDSRPI